MAHLLITNLKPNIENIFAACTQELYAADEANKLVEQGMSFRDAYMQIKQSMPKHPKPLPEDEILKKIKAQKSLGATGNLGLHILKEKLNDHSL